MPPGGALSKLRLPTECLSRSVLHPDTLVACILQRRFMLWVARDGWHGCNARWLWQRRALKFSEAESIGLLVTAGCQV